MALKRLAARGRQDPLDEEQYDEEDGTMPAFHSNSPTPEANASCSELSDLLEKAVLALPYAYRAVIVLRDVEEMNTAETAEVLSLTNSKCEGPSASLSRAFASRSLCARRCQLYASIRIPSNQV